MSVEKTACFFGHRRIDVTDGLMTALYKEIENLILVDKIDTFLFGSKSQFNDLCYNVVTDLKGKYPDTRRIYVRAEFEYIDSEGSRAYKEGLLEHYEDTYYPECVSGAGKAVYVKRNYHMIDESSVCVVFYNENYRPARRKQSSRALTDYQPSSGTGVAYKYAEKKNRKIINLYNINGWKTDINNKIATYNTKKCTKIETVTFIEVQSCKIRVRYEGVIDVADNEKLAQEAAFNRCVDFLVQMIEKYGHEVLAEIESSEGKEK